MLLNQVFASTFLGGVKDLGTGGSILLKLRSQQTFYRPYA